ncbi:MAG: hypothetical protein WBD02_10230 [Acidimicrobiia bacterium]
MNWEAQAVQLHHRIQEMAGPIVGLTTAGAIAGGMAGSAFMGAFAGLSGALGGVAIAHGERETRAEVLLAPYSHVRPRIVTAAVHR